MTDPRHTNIVEALYELQQEVGAIPRDANNPFFKSSYSSLPGIKALVDPIAYAHGLFVRQNLRGDVLRNRLYFNGEVEDDEDITMHLQQDNPQGHGSATSYYRRYAYTTCLGLVSAADDDDGNAASRQKSTTTRREPPKRSVDNDTGEITGDITTMPLVDLTRALEAAKLSVAGNTAAKRARLAEYQAGQPTMNGHEPPLDSESRELVEAISGGTEFAEGEEPF